jgi:hypothetical protein
MSPDQWEAYHIEMVHSRARRRGSSRCYRRSSVATALTEAPADPRLPISMTKDEDNLFTCIIGPPLVEDTVHHC